MPLIELIGVLGIAISVLAYLPQVVHLAKERCSAGVSGRAWAMWLVSSVLIGALAVHRRDLVFILLQVSSMTSAAIILSLARRYRGMVCEVHAHGRCIRTSGFGPDQHRRDEVDTGDGWGRRRIGLPPLSGDAVADP